MAPSVCHRLCVCIWAVIRDYYIEFDYVYWITCMLYDAIVCIQHMSKSWAKNSKILTLLSPANFTLSSSCEETAIT